MRKSRFREEQMEAVQREADRDPIASVAMRHGIREQTILRWLGALEPDERDARAVRQPIGPVESPLAAIEP